MRRLFFLAMLLLLTACATANDTHTDDHAGMTMDAMNESLEGKTGDDFDRAFIEAMIEHHEGAIQMARAARQSAGHDEIKTMAGEIIKAQSAEINQMKLWYESWGYGSL